MIDLKQQALDFLSSREDPVKLQSVMQVLGCDSSERGFVRELLAELVREGRVVRDDNRYWVPQGKQIGLQIKREKTRSTRELVGKLSVSRKGDGFVVNPRGEDWMVPARYLAGARQGDIVKVHSIEKGRGGRMIAEVTSIESYGISVAVGLFERIGRDLVFTAFGDHRIERSQLHDFPQDAEEDSVGQFLRQGPDKWKFAGFLGLMTDPGVDEAIVLAEGQITADFDAEALAELARYEHVDFVLGEREDFRDRLVFTVDGETARDFDDALHFRPLENGQIEVGIHIADVSHFVQPESALDLCARKRGNSVYLPHKAIPMLPELLSTELCSLKPNQPRYTLSVICLLDREGQLQSYRLTKGLIQSAYRLTYTLVDLMGISRDPQTREKYAEVLPAVELGLELSRLMKERRFAQGGLELDMPEVRAILDDDRALKEVTLVHQTDANRMIEAFMCLANECVARTMSELEIAIPYRVHDVPSPERLEELGKFWVSRGFEVPTTLMTHPAQALNEMIGHLASNPSGDVLQLQVLKSLKLAEYSVENRGHFGLASTHYAHFTSPIRRYADLIVHQRLTRMFTLTDPCPENFDDSQLVAICTHISERERVAAKAENTYMLLKQLRLMLELVGDTFEGVIMEVKPFGLFVRLSPWQVSGLVHLDTLTDDTYELNPETLALVGRRGRSFRVGDALEVVVDMVDLLARRIDLSISRMPERRAEPPRERKRERERERPKQGRPVKRVLEAAKKKKRRH